MRTGLGEGSFDTAAAHFTAASLGGAIAGALGHDGTQRRALDVLQELCWLRGCRLRKNSSNQWELYVDQAAASPAIALGFADAHYNNILEVVSYGRTPLTEKVKTLRLRYSLEGRRFRGHIQVSDYAHELARNIDPAIGVDVIRTSPWLRTFSEADRVIDYWEGVLETADVRLVVRVNPEARNVNVGDLAFVVIIEFGLAFAEMRIVRVTKRLAHQELVLVGYNEDAIFDYTPGVEPDPVNRDERLPMSGSGANLLPNPDFSQTPSPDETGGYFLAHKWLTPVAGGSGSWVFGRERDPFTTGGQYLFINKFNPGPGPVYIASVFFAVTAATRQYIFSVYADTETNLSLAVEWFGAGFTPISVTTAQLRQNEGDTNPQGWVRYFIRVSAPAAAAD